LNTLKTIKFGQLFTKKAFFIWIFAFYQIPILIIHLQTYVPFFNSWSYDSAHFFTQIDNIINRGFQDKFLPNNYSEHTYGEVPYNHNPNYQRFVGLVIYLLFNRNDKVTSIVIAEIVLILLIFLAYKLSNNLSKLQITIIFITIFTYVNFLITLLSPYRAILLITFPVVFMTLKVKNVWARVIYLVTFLFDPLLSILSYTSLLLAFGTMIGKKRVSTILFNGFVGFGVGSTIFLGQVVSYFGWEATLKEILLTYGSRSNWNQNPNVFLGNKNKIEDIFYLFTNEFPKWFWFGLLILFYIFRAKNIDDKAPTKVLSRVVLSSFASFIAFVLIMPNYAAGLQGAPGGYFPGYMPFSIWSVMILPIAIITSFNLTVNSVAKKFNTTIKVLVVSVVIYMNADEFIRFIQDKKWNQDIIYKFVANNQVKARLYMDFDPITFVTRITKREAFYITKATEASSNQLAHTNYDDTYFLSCEDNFYLKYQNFMYPQTCNSFFEDFSCPEMTIILKTKDAEIRRCKYDSKN
jgi:hypothetical protein